MVSIQRFILLSLLTIRSNALNCYPINLRDNKVNFGTKHYKVTD